MIPSLNPSESPSTPVVLVGLSGSGKSTVGELLARRWRIPFVDLDQEIEQAAGMSIPEIFRREGEDGFREREAEATRSVAPRGPVVVATGGGWMPRPELRDAWPTAVTIRLQVNPREAAKRLADLPGSRPLLVNESPEAVLEQLLEQRLPAYGLADYTVDTSARSPTEVAGMVVALLQKTGDGPGSDPNSHESRVEP
jgi:shikimate kinase